MGTDGARALAWRIAQQEQWRQAPAVLRGEQAPVDPDAGQLVDMADELRIYARIAGEQLRKRLVDGRWETEFVRLPREDARTRPPGYTDAPRTN